MTQIGSWHSKWKHMYVFKKEHSLAILKDVYSQTTWSQCSILNFFLQVTNDVISIPSDESSVESECLSDTDVRLNDKIKKSPKKKGKTGHL